MTRESYRNEVWILMHGSGSSLQETAAVRLYMDESGGEDPGTPDVVVGGMLIKFSEFNTFEDAWWDVLDRHGIVPPLHMKEFGKDGALSHITKSCRFELFSEISDLINHHKLYSIAAMLNNERYKNSVSKEMAERFSPYGMCFLLAVAMNHKLAENHHYANRIPIIMDTGNPKKGHVADSHAEIIRMQRDTFMHAGGLHFEDDRDFAILQAADVIAWAARRKTTGKPLPKFFSPISRILEFERHHVESDWSSEWMQTISAGVMKKYEKAKAELNERKE